MSELLTAAAQALGAPEAIVQRSAEARAKASGASVDEVLAAWAGGGAAPTAPAPAPAEPAPAPSPTPEPEGAPDEATPSPPPPPAPAPVSAAAPAAAAAAPPAVADRAVPPPILEGRTDRPLLLLAGAVGLFLLTMLVGFVAPSMPEDGTGVYTSAVAYSQLALQGRDVYLAEGCAACHTQNVRAIVPDAGLGPVTLSDTNQVIGDRRYGPDLAHVGSRLTAGDVELIDVLLGGGGHPSYGHLGDEQMQALVAYLMESE